ncbi:MAG: GntR family transcriptional regulator [Thermodesulfobacteriota bacterium]
MPDDEFKFEKIEKAGVPVYFQLAAAIQAQIEKGELNAGAMVPSERKVAAQNKISIATVRRAYEELVKSGFLKRIQGKGSFITSSADRRKQIRYYPIATGFEDNIFMLMSKLISITTIKADENVGHRLRVKNSAELFKIKRLLIHKDQPLIYCLSYLPKEIFPDLDKWDRLYFETYVFYIFLEEEFGISTINHTELIGVKLADKETSELLQVEKDYPLLEIEKIVYTHKNKPYEYRKSYCRTDKGRLRRNF